MVLYELGDKLSSALQRFQKSQTPIDQAALDAYLKEVSAILIQADVPIRQVAAIRAHVQKACSGALESQPRQIRRIYQTALVTALIDTLTPKKKPFVFTKNKVNIVLFVGLQGAGKTTTCTKYANYWKKRGWKVGLVCADTFRAGAFDQLKQNATKVKVPFYGSYSETDAAKVAAQGVDIFRREKMDIIIVDTSGRHRQETALFAEMAQINEAVKPDEVVFVMDSHIGQACAAQAAEFSNAVSVGSVIVTKLDGHAKGGGALAAIAATGAPITFIGVGEDFADFELFSAQGFVSRMLGLGDVEGLMRNMQAVVPAKKQKVMMEQILKGQITYRSMVEQMEAVQSIGSVGSLMAMVPGLSSMAGMVDNREAALQMQRVAVIVSSMTEKEKDLVHPLTLSRARRICRGCGVALEELAGLALQRVQMSAMMKGVGKMAAGKPPGKGQGKMLKGMPGMPPGIPPGMPGGIPGGIPGVSQQQMQQMRRAAQGPGGIQGLMSKLMEGGIPGIPGMAGIPGLPGLPGLPGSAPALSGMPSMGGSMAGPMGSPGAASPGMGGLDLQAMMQDPEMLASMAGMGGMGGMPGMPGMPGMAEPGKRRGRTGRK